MLKEFKTFITQGNVLDLAVGVIIGGAFSKITTSLVDDIIMPIVGYFLAGVDFKTLALHLGQADEKGVYPVNIMYGNFIQIVIQFLIVAWVIFLFVKAANKARLTEK
jgi:large conductance mechanosensitive channel